MQAQARSQGGGGGAVASPPPHKKWKREGERERQKRKIKLRVCMWSCRLSTISKVRLNINSCYTRKIPAYAPHCTINNIKMQKALTVGGRNPLPHHHPPPLVRSIARYFEKLVRTLLRRRICPHWHIEFSFGIPFYPRIVIMVEQEGSPSVNYCVPFYAFYHSELFCEL